MYTNLIIIMVLLTVPVALQFGLSRLGVRTPSHAAAGVTGLAIAFVFFGIGHFVRTAGMVDMLPPWVPFREAIVYLTGLWEFAIAAALVAPSTRRLAGLAALASLVVFFSANVYAALNYTGLGGHASGPSYLLVRAPVQVILIAWTYWFALRRHASKVAPSGQAA